MSDSTEDQRQQLPVAAAREQATAPDTAGFAWAVSFNPFTYLDAIAIDTSRQREARRR